MARLSTFLTDFSLRVMLEFKPTMPMNIFPYRFGPINLAMNLW